MRRRGSLSVSACGVCGRMSIDDLRARCSPSTYAGRPRASWISDCVKALASCQATFRKTGGVHAAAVFDESGTELAAAEDVGRHNAVDKVVGALLRRGLLAVPRSQARSQSQARPESQVSPGAGTPALLAVSGRVSFEIVQKAAVAGLHFVAGVSAPTSLAVELATEMNLTLAGFVRGDAYNLYSGSHRIDRDG